MPARCETSCTRYARLSAVNERLATELARMRDISPRVSSPIAARARGVAGDAGAEAGGPAPGVLWAALRAGAVGEAPELGQGEVAERPMAAPKVSRTNDIPAAKKAPARTAPHSTKLAPAVAVPLEPSGAGPTCVMTFVSYSGLVQAEKAED